MYQALVPCPSCTRHVRAAETSCPFCKNALPESHASGAVPSATQRMSRAAAFAFTASIAVTGCSAGTTPIPVSDSGTSKDGAVAREGGIVSDDGGHQAAYGAPAYGGPPFVASTEPDDSGGGQALYGAPAPVDAGKD